jgi:hypothetical protein
MKAEVAGLLLAAGILFGVGAHRARECQANLPGHRHGTALYWLLAVGVGAAVSGATAISLPRWGAWWRAGAGIAVGLLAGVAAYIFIGLSWVGACG